MSLLSNLRTTCHLVLSVVALYLAYATTKPLDPSLRVVSSEERSLRGRIYVFASTTLAALFALRAEDIFQSEEEVLSGQGRREDEELRRGKEWLEGGVELNGFMYWAGESAVFAICSSLRLLKVDRILPDFLSFFLWSISRSSGALPHLSLELDGSASSPPSRLHHEPVLPRILPSSRRPHSHAFGHQGIYRRSIERREIVPNAARLGDERIRRRSSRCRRRRGGIEGNLSRCRFPQLSCRMELLMLDHLACVDVPLQNG